jgi:hypothetical protein
VLPRRRVVTTLVVRRVGTEPCLQAPLPFALKISDRNRRGVGDWDSYLDFAAPFAPDTERAVSLPNVYSCDRPGPFHAMASVGPYTARRGHLSYSAITCWNGKDQRVSPRAVVARLLGGSSSPRTRRTAETGCQKRRARPVR